MSNIQKVYFFPTITFKEAKALRFEELNLDPEIMDGILALGFEEATPIQELAIPLIVEGNDLIGCAQTGTGKTAAFVIPTIQKIMREEKKGISTLIIVPTRELAIQIDQNIEALAYFTGVSSVAVYGGRDSSLWDHQKNAISGGADGVDIIIATPGRFKTHHSLGYMDLSHVNTVILDEADKMLDMGFFSDILEITSFLPAERQSLMFSATMPKKIRKLAKEILKPNPKEISLALSKPAANVNQLAYMVYQGQKIPLLEHIIKEREVDSMIIFASSKISVDQITRKLQRLKYDARAIHSDRSQEERTETLSLFKNKQFPIVVATDVLSRGIDIDNLSHVLNFDVPGDAEDYVHRIGRTARASSSGEAITFIMPEDAYKFFRIEELIERTLDKSPVPAELGETPEYRKGSGGRDGGRGGRHGGGGGRGGNSRGGESRGRNTGGNKSSHRNRNDRNRGGGGGENRNSGNENRGSGSGESSRTRNRNRNRKPNTNSDSNSNEGPKT